MSVRFETEISLSHLFIISVLQITLCTFLPQIFVGLHFRTYTILLLQLHPRLSFSLQNVLNTKTHQNKKSPPRAFKCLSSYENLIIYKNVLKIWKGNIFSCNEPLQILLCNVRLNAVYSSDISLQFCSH